MWIGIHIKYFTFIGPDFDLSFGNDDINSKNPDFPVWAVITTIIVVGIIGVIIAIFQLRDIYRRGKLAEILGIYLVLFVGISIAILVVRKSLYVHIHHYLIGILLFPATCFKTRLSMFLQSVLFGLFVNGASRWGFDSLLEAGGSGPNPDPPYWMNVTNVTRNSISLVWEAVNATEPVYMVKANELLAYIGTETQTTILNLLPNLNYTFCVAQVVSGVAGKCNAPLNVTTSPDFMTENETQFY